MKGDMSFVLELLIIWIKLGEENRRSFICHRLLVIYIEFVREGVGWDAICLKPDSNIYIESVRELSGRDVICLKTLVIYN